MTPGQWLPHRSGRGWVAPAGGAGGRRVRGGGEQAELHKVPPRFLRISALAVGVGGQGQDEAPQQQQRQRQPQDPDVPHINSPVFGSSPSPRTRKDVPAGGL